MASSWPKYIIPPHACQLRTPALNMTTGMPAARAFWMVGQMAAGFGSVTAMPATWLLIASVIRLACLVGSGSEEYLSETLSLAAAARAPWRMMSQKVSPGAACVIMAIVYCGVVAWPAATPVPAPSVASCAASFPPVALQAARTRARTRSSAVPTARLGDLNICGTSGFLDDVPGCGWPWPVRSGGGGEMKVRAMVLLVGAVWPATGDGFGVGVEADAFRAVHVGVAEERVLPPAEGVEGHRHRDRDVDADHPDLDLALEFLRRLPAGGEDRGAVAVRVGVDDVDGLAKRLGPEDDEHRTEDLVGIDVHVGGDVVEQARADEEAVLVAGHVQAAAVHDERGAGLLAAVDVADDAVPGLRRDHRAHVGRPVAARADPGVLGLL